MMQGYEDLFVGTVSCALGVFFITTAATNWAWYYSLRSARFLEKRLGRTGARLVHALLGMALIALGVTIALGIRLGFGRT